MVQGATPAKNCPQCGEEWYYSHDCKAPPLRGLPVAPLEEIEAEFDLLGTVAESGIDMDEYIGG